MDYYFFSVHGLLLLTWATVGIQPSAIRKELDFLLTDETSNFYGLSPTKDEYAIIHIGASTPREKRSTTSPEMTQVSFRAFGEDYRIHLKPNYLIPQGLYAKYVNEKGVVTKVTRINSTRCHYMGKVTSHAGGNDTLSAISLCDGMSGVIATGKHTLYINPLRDDHVAEYLKETKPSAKSEDRPHLVYRRDVTDDTITGNENGEYFCGLDKRHFHLHDSGVASRVPEREADRGDEVLPRKKRQTVEKHLEVMVTVDKDMAMEYGEDATDYAMDLLNIAASRFQHESLGSDTLLYFHVVEVIVLTSDTTIYGGATLQVSTEAATTLTNFCSYQTARNSPSDADDGHWDLAILLTRKDIELTNLTGLLGIAMHQGTCNRTRECLLLEDYGPAAGLVLAHEIGHTLGMYHDGVFPHSQSCEGGKNLMSENRITGDGAFKWSQCSQFQYKKFISKAVCLDDQPSQPALSEDSWKTVGEQYNANKQCQLYSPTAPFACTESQLNSIGRTLSDTCGVLHCVVDGKCVATNLPSVDGTRCGSEGQVCREGRCDDGMPEPVVRPPPAVNGRWSNWETLGTCSRTCGGGIEVQYRVCNNPEPAFGGQPCQGDATRVRICNPSKCAVSQVDYRHEQCHTIYGPGYSALNTQTGDSVGLCSMNCVSSDGNVISSNTAFADGTYCGVDEEYQKCYNRRCQTFGCDNVMGSNVNFDMCGVCGGGNTCRRDGDFDSYAHAGENITVLVFPTGTTGISVHNRNIGTFIGLGRSVDDNLIIDGRFQRLGQTMQIDYVGDMIYYNKSTQSENIEIPGPTKTEYRLKIRFPNDRSVHQCSIDYEYYSTDDVIPVNNYLWRIIDGQCINGTAIDTVICLHLESNAPSNASLCDQTTRPSPFRTCDIPSFTSLWVYGSYGECNATCGSDSYRTRPALCLALSEANCIHLEAPIIHQKCDVPLCQVTYEWVQSVWSPCSVCCGGGIQQRYVYCRNTTNPPRFVPGEYCLADTKPITQRPCSTEACIDVACVPDVIRIIDLGGSPVAVTFPEPTATDNSGSVSPLSRSHSPGQFFPTGITTVTYVFGDPSGDTTQCTCSFDIIVIEVDNVPPVVTCVADVTRTIGLGGFGTNVNFTEPTATDNSGSFSVQFSHLPGGFFQTGITAVTYVFTDLSGNTAECTFHIIVNEGCNRWIRLTEERPIAFLQDFDSDPGRPCRTTLEAPNGYVINIKVLFLILGHYGEELKISTESTVSTLYWTTTTPVNVFTNSDAVVISLTTFEYGHGYLLQYEIKRDGLT